MTYYIVIGFVHVYKSSTNVEDVAIIHPDLKRIFEQCHAGISRAKKDENKDNSEDINDNSNSNIIKVEENEDEDDDSFIVDDINGSSHNEYIDEYWIENIDDSRSQFTGSSSSTPHKKKRKSMHDKHYWFVDRTFLIEPYQVNGSLGGMSKFYNISKRNKAEAVYLGQLLSNYLFHGNRENEDNISESSHENEDDDIKRDELPEDEVNTLKKTNTNKVDLSDEEEEITQDVLWLDRTLGKHVGIKNIRKNRLNKNRKINGWNNVLNDFTVFEVDEIVQDENNQDIIDDYDDDDDIESLPPDSEHDNDVPVKSYQLLKAAGAVEDDSMSIFDTATSELSNRMIEQSRAPHIDDSSDSDYLGDEDDLEEEDKPRSQRKSLSIMNVSSDEDIDLADIEREILNVCNNEEVSFTTKGGPDQNEEDDMRTVAMEDIDEELDRILHDEQSQSQEIEKIEMNENIINDEPQVKVEEDINYAIKSPQNVSKPVINVKNKKIRSPLKPRRVQKRVNRDRWNGHDRKQNNNNHDRQNMDDYNSFDEELKADNQERIDDTMNRNKSPKKVEFVNDTEAFNHINEAVQYILNNASDQEKRLLTKKKLRQIVSRKLNISKTKYKRIIDKCAQIFIQKLMRT